MSLDSFLDRAPQGIANVAGTGLLAFGLWAMIDPQSFFDALATFEPYNKHLIQDLGAFQIGLGAVLLLAAWPRVDDALIVALAGVGIGMVAHVVSHVIGHDLGGTPEVDIPFFALLGGLLLAAAWVRADRA